MKTNYLIYGGPWLIAAARGIITAALLGAEACVGAWKIGGSAEEIAIAGLGVFITALLVRGGAEGWLDRKNDTVVSG